MVRSKLGFTRVQGLAVGGLAAAMLALSACGGSSPTASPSDAAEQPQATDAKVSEAPNAQSPQPTLGTLKLVQSTAPPDPTSHFFYYARENGFYKELGLNVEITPVKGDQTALRAIASGEADVAWTGFEATLAANESGGDFKFISCFSPKVDYLLVATTDVKSPRDLVGRRLAVSEPGAVSHQVPKMMIEADGGDASKVNLVSVGGSASRVQALIARKVDGAALNYTFAQKVKDYDYLHVVVEAATAVPNYLYGCEVTREKAIDERKELLQAFVTGTMKGVRWALQNPNQAAAISQKVLPDEDKTILAAGIKHYVETKYWNADGILEKVAFDFSQDQAVRAGTIKQKVNYEQVYYSDFIKNAQAALK